jgi:hypothetical protein
MIELRRHAAKPLTHPCAKRVDPGGFVERQLRVEERFQFFDTHGHRIIVTVNRPSACPVVIMRWRSKIKQPDRYRTP